MNVSDEERARLTLFFSECARIRGESERRRFVVGRLSCNEARVVKKAFVEVACK